MKNKKIADALQKLNDQLTNKNSIDLFVDFYDRLLSNLSSLEDLNSISRLYCLYNPETEKVMISEKLVMNL